MTAGLTTEVVARVSAWALAQSDASQNVRVLSDVFVKLARMGLGPGRDHSLERARAQAFAHEAAATGCLLALVREAWTGHSIELTLQDNGDAILRVMHPGNHLRCMFSRDSGADALVDALESAP